MKMGKQLIAFNLLLFSSGEGLKNAGFESTDGWENLDRSTGKSTPSIRCQRNTEKEERCPDGSEQQCTFDQRDAPPEGTSFAILTGAGESLEQALGDPVKEGKAYELKFFARGINPSWGGVNAGVDAVNTKTEVTATLMVGDVKMETITVDVGAPKMKGMARADLDCEGCSQDDGANVWLAGDYRFHVGQGLFYQEKSSDPISDPWEAVEDSPLNDFDGMAKSPIVTPQGLTAIGGTWYKDESPVWSKMSIHILSGDPPNYKISGLSDDGVPTEDAIILSNMENTELPWAIDSHFFYDEDTERLWMTWGGHETWITELDPATGKVCCSPKCTSEDGHCATPEYKDHPAGTHTKILSWDDLAEPDNGFLGDGCGLRYMEGPSLYKYKEWFFAFSSWGSMGEDYTIRMCRSKNPRGPYLDKDGKDCAKLEDGMYGSSMLLGPEGEESTPGHAHVWEEDSVFYLGYDFRKGPAEYPSGQEGSDFMAIRKLHWVKATEGWWPTIWQPIELSATATAEMAGKTLKVVLSNPSSGSVAAVDMVTLEVTDAIAGKSDDNGNDDENDDDNDDDNDGCSKDDLDLPDTAKLRSKHFKYTCPLGSEYKGITNVQGQCQYICEGDDDSVFVNVVCKEDGWETTDPCNTKVTTATKSAYSGGATNLMVFSSVAVVHVVALC